MKKTATRKTNGLLNALVNADNVTFTENGAKTYKSTLSHTLDFFSTGAALRNRSESEVTSLFSKALAEDPLIALKALFNVRNVRGGAGERKTFRTILKNLASNHPSYVKKNLENIVHFGRWDDLFVLLGTRLEKDVLKLVAETLRKDVICLEKDQSVSLLGKWMPSENASSQATKKLAKVIREYLGWSERTYRKTLSALRKQIDIVERYMSEKDWSDINYSTVPSKANMKYRNAFKKNDEARYLRFIEDVKKGDKKIKAATLFPYEIVSKLTGYNSYANKDDETLDVLWNSLPNYLEGSDRNILCVCDVSGSMSGMPMDVSVSLGIYTAEKNKGPFANYFITYSSEPTLQKVIGKNIREKVANLQKTCAYSTDLQKVFTMLLREAVKNRVSQEDMPEQIIVITDVEFNNPQNGKTNLQAIKDQYRNAGYNIPQLVFWNVNSRQANVPATANEKGVLLVSGASPSVFKTLLSGKQYTPIDQMMATLGQTIYDRVVV